MPTELASQHDASPLDPLGGLALDVEGRRTPASRPPSALPQSLAAATMLHGAFLTLAFWIIAPSAVSDRESALESIGVDIVIERTATRSLPEPGGAPGREDDSLAATPAPDLATRETEQPAAAAALVAPEPTAPPAPEADQEAVPAETEAAPQVAERIAMPGIVTTTAAPLPSAPVDAAVDDSKPSPEANRTVPVAAPLPTTTAGGGRSSAYLSSVFETLRNRPPRPYAGQRRTVLVRFVIGRDGNVTTVEVRRTGGSPEVDEMAREFIRRTRFPAPPADVPAKDLDIGIELTFG